MAAEATSETSVPADAPFATIVASAAVFANWLPAAVIAAVVPASPPEDANTVAVDELAVPASTNITAAAWSVTCPIGQGYAPAVPA